MPVTALFAQLACRDDVVSGAWFATLFDRPPDATPMAGLTEWHLGAAGFQLFEGPGNAGHGTMTVFVDDLRAECARLAAAGIDLPETEAGDTVDIVQLRDPDGNLVVLVQPREG